MNKTQVVTHSKSPKQTGHTPGPWKVGGRTVLAIQYDQRPGAVCICKGEEAYANARLIAAAPELLEALKDIVEQYKKTRCQVGVDLSDSIRVFGTNAIAKAEGTPVPE